MILCWGRRQRAHETSADHIRNNGRAEQLIENLLAANQQDMNMARLRDALARFSRGWEAIALNQRHLIEMVGQHAPPAARPCSRQLQQCCS